MGAKGTRFIISKSNQRGPLGFVSFTTNFHLNLKHRHKFIFWAFGTQYLSDCFDVHIVGKLLNCTSLGGSFAQLWVVSTKLWLFEGWLKSWFKTTMFFCTLWG